ncbi:MAG: hypothetical protein ACRCVU_20210 [Flavobacterium sp.]
MLWAIGYAIYFAVIMTVIFLPSAKIFILNAFGLAPEITSTMMVLYLIPLVIFSYHVAYDKKSLSDKKFLSSQTILCSSLSVSLGLIGTFLGLTDMVAAISLSMSAEGDVSEKMGNMLSSVSTALSAMSYAFLTSVVGVGVSVLLLISHNFLAFFYHKNEHTDSNGEDVLSRLNRIEEINTNLVGKLISIPLHRDDDNAYIKIFESLVHVQKEQILMLDEQHNKLTFIMESLVEINRAAIKTSESQHQEISNGLYNLQQYTHSIDEHCCSSVIALELANEKLDKLTIFKETVANEERSFRAKLKNAFGSIYND